MTNKVTEAAYKAQIATLQAQLMQRHTVMPSTLYSLSVKL